LIGFEKGTTVFSAWFARWERDVVHFIQASPANWRHADHASKKKNHGIANYQISSIGLRSIFLEGKSAAIFAAPYR
jgi:hypothetical protein